MRYSNAHKCYDLCLIKINNSFVSLQMVSMVKIKTQYVHFRSQRSNCNSDRRLGNVQYKSQN